MKRTVPMWLRRWLCRNLGFHWGRLGVSLDTGSGVDCTVIYRHYPCCGTVDFLELQQRKRRAAK